MEPEAKPEDKKEYYAYDVRSDEVFKFRRMNKYILLQSTVHGVLMKISVQEFEDYFEGTPTPVAPYIVRTK